ncbi:hypothetical protein [Paenibacillus vini]|uniref:HTH merR-type domain-containing protein n=1 Tax=Paenibacillus vini TaxID=1476024 RepID=A0ABQ4M9B1_9BACL|nr:hypothetical protein [Paenibacillus vini]GIP52212.1 hypothetical protein J42TS3_12470 [Paenibacillus vini]
MNNLERLKLEIQQSGFTDSELSIFLEESNLSPTVTYDTSSNESKRAILQTALSCLEAIANNPNYFKNMKIDDMTVSSFAESITNRIDQLERKLRSMTINQSETGSSTFMLFNR